MVKVEVEVEEESGEIRHTPIKQARDVMKCEEAVTVEMERGDQEHVVSTK
jgi:hypothetical protein